MKRLRELRQSHKITQIKLAMDVNISQKMISAYERGTNEPSLEMLVKFARYFHTSVDYLIGYSDIKQPYKASSASGYNQNELLILEMYQNLSNSNQFKVEGYITALVDAQNNDSKI